MQFKKCMKILCNMIISSYNCLILKPSKSKRMKKLMKITLILAGFFCLSGMISAQTVGKGAWMVGGAAGFTSSKFKDADNSTTTVIIAPNLGYFIADDLALGLGVGFVSTSFNGNSNSSFNLGPFARYYVTEPIFVQVGADLGLDEGAGTTIGASVGYSWFLNNGVAVEPALFFNIFNNDGDAGDFTIFGLSIGVQAFVHHEHGLPD